MYWKIGMIANAVVSIAYLMIVYAILRPLIQSKQLRTNPLGAATAAIFFSCAVHHGMHVVHMALPFFGVGRREGFAMRASYDWESAFWDVVTAMVGAYYWTLRRTYGSLMQGAQLFQDMRQREQQALELNDTVLQGMVVAKLALDLDDPSRAREALQHSMSSASHIISDLLGPASERGEQALLRTRPALLEGEA